MPLSPPSTRRCSVPRSAAVPHAIRSGRISDRRRASIPRRHGWERAALCLPQYENAAATPAGTPRLWSSATLEPVFQSLNFNLEYLEGGTNIPMFLQELLRLPRDSLHFGKIALRNCLLNGNSIRRFWSRHMN